MFSAANVYGTISTIRSFVPLLREYTGPSKPRIVYALTQNNAD